MRGESSSSALAPGFRFHPTDEELVSYYLKRKVSGRPFRFDAISEIDIYKSEPWDLPGYSRLKSRDLEWYFFSALDKKYGNGWRTNRATDQGYWKTTGKDRSIQRGNHTVGMKKTLVYHIGRAPRGERTNWVMHEYRLVDDQLGQAGIAQDAFVLCRIFQKSGTGPKNGEQYGAPFVEEEWDDDISDPAEELGGNDDGYFDVGNEGFSHQQNYVDENIALEIPPLDSVLPVDHNTWDGGKIIEDPICSVEEDQKHFIGTGENDVLPELHDEPEFFDFPEQLQIEQTSVKNEYIELDDLLDPVDTSYEADGLVTGEQSNLAATNDLPVHNEETNGFEISFKPDPSGFEMLDEYLTYFDASNDYLNYLDLDLDYPKTSDFDDSVINNLATPEEVNETFENTQVEGAEPSKPHGDEVASCSKQMSDNEKAGPDVKYNEGWDSTIAKQVSRMLGSISAPPAFASEFPTKQASLGQNSATQSSSSIHVTAGMIHIHTLTVDNGKDFSWRKNEGVDVLLHYGLTSNESMTEYLMWEKASVSARCMFYFFFLWVLILSVSYKVGSYICSR